MPLPANGDFAGELAGLRERTLLAVGYSGDWSMAPAMLAGADAFNSILGSILPVPTLALVRATQKGYATEDGQLDGLLAPLWGTFRAYGSLRVRCVLLDALGPGHAEPSHPILPLEAEARGQGLAAAEPLLAVVQTSLLVDFEPDVSTIASLPRSLPLIREKHAQCHRPGGDCKVETQWLRIN